MKTFLKEDDIWALSITITGRCNCYCSYCHYYAYRNRKKYNYDIPETLFKNYVELIKVIQNKYHKNIQVRFSGGEPLVIGKKLFQYSDYLYKETGLKPYVLTNGKALTQEVVNNAKEANISAFLVSVENPFDESEGVPGTNETLEKIMKLDNNDVRVIPAVVVVKNQYFTKLKDICDIFYRKIKSLPVISELTFHTFEEPTDEEIEDLYKNVKQIALEYYGVTPIRIFPYISPELYASGSKNYLNELDIENTLKINQDNIEALAPKLFRKLEGSYREYECENKKCDWYDDCKIIKWLWFLDKNGNGISDNNNMKSYCAMKKAINRGLLDGIVEKAKLKDNRISGGRD